MGRVIGDEQEVAAQGGDTLVTSIDAKVQSVVEQQLAGAIAKARATRDTVTDRNYVADSGAVVVMEAKTGRIVSMASQPTYDPEVWVGGVSQRQLKQLYSKKAGTPLLGRATQGQFAPGSTWKPFMTAGALSNGYPQDTQLNCSSVPAGRQPGLQELRVRLLRLHHLRPGPRGLVQHVLLPGRARLLAALRLRRRRRQGQRPARGRRQGVRVRASETGIDLPGEAAGRIADRQWKRDYYEAMKDYYCELGEEKGDDFVHRFAREFCVEGYAYRAGDAVNFAIGQGDTILTPLQLARGYAAIANGGTLYAPRVAKAVVSEDGTVLKRFAPKPTGRVDVTRRVAGVRRQRRCSAYPRSARWPGSSPTSRSTGCRSAARPAPRRSTASSRRPGSRPTTRTTWS